MTQEVLKDWTWAGSKEELEFKSLPWDSTTRFSYEDAVEEGRGDYTTYGPQETSLWLAGEGNINDRDIEWTIPAYHSNSGISVAGNPSYEGLVFKRRKMTPQLMEVRKLGWVYARIKAGSLLIYSHTNLSSGPEFNLPHSSTALSNMLLREKYEGIKIRENPYAPLSIEEIEQLPQGVNIYCAVSAFPQGNTQMYGRRFSPAEFKQYTDYPEFKSLANQGRVFLSPTAADMFVEKCIASFCGQNFTEG